MSKIEFVLALDGGGTKCKAILYCLTSKRVLSESLAGPCNPFQNLARAQQSICDAAQLALTRANLTPSKLSSLCVVAGLAGINIPSTLSQMQQWQHPFHTLHLTTDLHIAVYGAHNALTGAAIVTGTGSCGFSITKNNARMLGGHGFLLGDMGSAAWVGLQAVKHTLLVLDGIEPASELTGPITSHLSTTNSYQLVEQLTLATSTDYGALAPLVFSAAEQNDHAAQAILKQAGLYLSKLAQQLINEGADSIALLGGLAPHIKCWINEDIQRTLQPAQMTPEHGALLYAKHLLSQNNHY